MLKRVKNGKQVPTELSWEEKNPQNYVYRPSKAMIKLRKEIEQNKG